MWFCHITVTQPPSAEVFQHQTDPATARCKGLCLFPPREKNLRLDVMGSKWLLFFQSVQVIVYISPEVFVPFHGFNPNCFLSLFVPACFLSCLFLKEKSASYLGLLRHMSQHLIFWFDLWSVCCYFLGTFFFLRLGTKISLKLGWINV